jgi:hypothetical protein
VCFHATAFVADDAKVESDRQTTACDAIEKLEKSDVNTWHARLVSYAPIPILYSDVGSADYACFFVMERVHGLAGMPQTRGRMVHMALSGNAPRSGLFGVDYSMSEERLQTCDPSLLRGYFVGPDRLASFLKDARRVGYAVPTVDDVYAAVGRAYGAVLGSGLDARDIEIVLAEDPCPVTSEPYASSVQRHESARKVALWIMDFGMCVPYDPTDAEKMLSVYQQMTIDLYAPSYSTENTNLWSSYAHGLLLAFRHGSAYPDAGTNLASAMSAEIVDDFDGMFLRLLQVDSYAAKPRDIVHRMRRFAFFSARPCNSAHGAQSTPIGRICEAALKKVLNTADDAIVLATRIDACSMWYRSRFADLLDDLSAGKALSEIEKKYDGYGVDDVFASTRDTTTPITDRHRAVFMECVATGRLDATTCATRCSDRP